MIKLKKKELLKFNKVHLVGFSIGSLIARNFATKFNNRLKSLILLGSIYKRSEEQQRIVNERFNQAKSKTGLDDTFLIGSGKIKGLATTVAAMTFEFMGGSCGAAASEAMVKAAENSIT